MTDHLPECPCNNADERGCFLISAETDRCVSCICPALRACEQRVREEMQHPDPGISEKQAIANYAIYRNGYAAGVQAARDAVAALPKEDGGYCHVFHACDVEAAIDALREEKP